MTLSLVMTLEGDECPAVISEELSHISQSPACGSSGTGRNAINEQCIVCISDGVLDKLPWVQLTLGVRCR